MARLYPLFLDLAGAPVLVVGAGTISARKVESLLRCYAEVKVVAPSACAEILAIACQNRIDLELRVFAPADVVGKRLVIAATSSRDVNRAVSSACRASGVLVNAVDDPGQCDFYSAAVVERGMVQIAISTGGAVPALAALLRDEIGCQLEGSLGAYAELVSEARACIMVELADRSQGERKRAMNAVLSTTARELLALGDEEGARRSSAAVLDSVLGRGIDDEGRE